MKQAVTEQATRIFCRAYANRAKEIKNVQRKIMHETKILSLLTVAQNKLIDKSVLVPGTYEVDDGFVIIINTKQGTMVEFFTKRT